MTVAPPAPRWLGLAVWAALAFGFVYRLLPPLLSEDRLRAFFPTEDGYLMLTVARNLALGHGLSVADGSIATNGIQPLATYVFALPYWLTGGDKFSGLLGVMLVSTLVAVAAALVIFAFARSVLGLARSWAGLVAALWFATPLALFHSMNALETGLNVLAVTLCLTIFAALERQPGHYRLAQAVGYGCLLGLAFLTRIDNAILVTALIGARLVENLRLRRPSLAGNFRDIVLPGAISLVWAAPWLIYNYRLFGTIMPISGIAESMTARFAQNLHLVPTKLLETTLPMLPLPGRLEGSVPLAWAALAVVLGIVALALVRTWPGRDRAARVAILAGLGFVAGVSLWYGLYFGAPHFIARYFAPFQPLLSGLAVALVAGFARGRLAIPGLATAALVLGVALTARLALPGAREQGHFQVVDWVSENVPEDTWVGAIQTGTLGYWHDRTLNLDGKVNPQALRARLENGDVFDYVLASPIEYLADWDLRSWVDGRHPAFAQAFEVLVDDRKARLSVLRRR